MNFLAHFHLGKSTDEDILGNFIGDFVKGSDYKQYNHKVQRGILMHRCIDSFTDSNIIVLEAKHKFSHLYGHFTGVVMDVFYDYFLSNNWNTFSETSLPDFIEHCYDVLNKYQDDMPFSAQVAYRHMIKNDWLNRYNNLIGLQKTFLGINQYVKRETGMENAIQTLNENKAFLNQNFLSFYPLVQDRVKLFMEEYK